MKKSMYMFSIFVAFLLVTSPKLYAHCEIPCGIYDDEAQIEKIFQHIDTIEKSMREIVRLDDKKNRNANQIVRWIMNKEAHADKIQNIVTQYFMTQRIKLDAKQYDKKIRTLHQILITSMKCKQTTDIAHTKALKKDVSAFKKLYF